VSDTPADELTERAAEYLDRIVGGGETTPATCEAMDVSPRTVRYYREQLREAGIPLTSTDDDPPIWHRADSEPPDATGDAAAESDEPLAEDWRETPVAADDPSPRDLTERERYIATELQTGASVEELAEDIGTRPTVISQHLRDLRGQGWQVYFDETTEDVVIEGDTALRSSEHTGTRTRKANRWWERRHNELVRQFKGQDAPTAELSDAGDEDIIIHLTDVHAGDEVHTPDLTNVYNIDTVGRIVRYVTDKALELAEYHGEDYGTCHLCWGGDMVTNEGIYSGQFEDLDAWLDEQAEGVHHPLMEQIYRCSDRFDAVNVVTQVGNHGEMRASGTSRQANADLLVYKGLRNSVADVRRYGEGSAFDNVNFNIGQGRPYVNFPVRGGRLTGHLRHGQDRKPYAQTAASGDDWKTTLLNHDFDVSLIGHHHVSGRIPWDGPPVVASGSPKPPGHFVDQIAGATSLDPRETTREIGHVLTVADHGITAEMPIKTHDFEYAV